MVAIIGALIAMLGAVAVALIESRAAKDRKKSQAEAQADRERVERRATIRERESRLSMELMSAACALSLVTAKKLTGQHTNGDVEEAMDKAKAAQEDYDNFVSDVAAHQVCKT